MVDTSDEWIVAAHRHRAAPHRGRRRDHLSMLGIKAAEAALADAGLDGRGHRPHRLRHLDAGPHLPGDRHADPGGARHHPRRGLRPAGRLLRLRLCVAIADKFLHSGLAQARAGDRRRDLLAHPRLDRPHHLRAVRRRCRRRRARGRRRARARSPTAASSRRICARTGAIGTSSTSMAARLDARPVGHCAWKAARSSAMPSA